MHVKRMERPRILRTDYLVVCQASASLSGFSVTYVMERLLDVGQVYTNTTEPTVRADC